MRLHFISNYYSHHQNPLCIELNSLLDGEFLFFENEEISEKRKKLGWKSEKAQYVKSINTNDKEMIFKADIVIYGNAPRELIEKILKREKLVFFYSERIYKNGYKVLKWPIRLYRFWNRYGRYSNMYLLCASAYTMADYAKHFTFLNKSYKWGYFPETKHYDIEALENKKNRKKILWCGRFIDWKHPDDAIAIAEFLLADGYYFDMYFIGTGEMEEALKQMINIKGLENNVHVLGSMKPEQVRCHMEKAGIFLFTSDFAEGWGAVLNESMNSGCAVVASHAIGSVPFLIKHKENGLIYRSRDVDNLYKNVKYLLDKPEEQKRMGEKAYHTIVDLWNAETAAERFLKLVKEIKDHGYCDLYEEGPCSKAEIIKNNWFKE